MSDELRKSAQDVVDAWDAYRMVGGGDIKDLRAALAKNANAAPDSSLAPLIESLIGKYWDIAYEEGKTGISQGDLANQVLGRIRNALIAWAQRAAPQDQDAKDAALYRYLKTVGWTFVEGLETRDWDETIVEAMQEVKP